jgi:hypothetical protein
VPHEVRPHSPARAATAPPALPSVDLPVLEAVFGELVVKECAGLTSLSGLAALGTIGECCAGDFQGRGASIQGTDAGNASSAASVAQCTVS